MRVEDQWIVRGFIHTVEDLLAPLCDKVDVTHQEVSALLTPFLNSIEDVRLHYVDWDIRNDDNYALFTIKFYKEVVVSPTNLDCIDYTLREFNYELTGR